MKYPTPGAFRDALEARIRERRPLGGSPSRLRKQVVFDRLLLRLDRVAEGRWVLKGGFALELRLHGRARSTRDVDVDWDVAREQALELLLDAAQLDLGDFFELQLRRGQVPPGAEARGQRYHVTAMLAGRVFEQVALDVGFDAPPVLDPERITGPPLLEFAGLEPATIPAASLEQHLAEKVHAYTRTYGGSHPSSRVKDLIDMVLIAEMAEFEAARLRRAVELVFEQRNAPIPNRLPAPPLDWERPWRVLAAEVEIGEDVGVGHGAAPALVDPILVGAASGHWDPERQQWVGG